ARVFSAPHDGQSGLPDAARFGGAQHNGGRMVAGISVPGIQCDELGRPYRCPATCGGVTSARATTAAGPWAGIGGIRYGILGANGVVELAVADHFGPHSIVDEAAGMLDEHAVEVRVDRSERFAGINGSTHGRGSRGHW